MNTKKTISIIDDDPIFVFLTKKSIELTNMAHNVIVFANGLDAITYFKENMQHSELMPDVILLDLSMPIMDGWQFLDEFKFLYPKIEKKIIIYIYISTISSSDIKRVESISAVSDFIIKPVSKDQLKEIVKNL